MARKRDRFFAAMGAILFLVTASSLTIAVVMQMVSQHNADKASKKASTSNSAEVKPTDNSNKLQGTKLANFTPFSDVPKLQIIDITPGTGQEVKPSDTVTVDYTGAVAATGVIFQSSKDAGQPVTFGLSGVIKGWTEGVPGMKVGGTRRLIIPADMAYGNNPPPGSGIPANAPLVFDITLHSIQ